MQSLDTLGAGFSLASHDLDIRGAGNLLGEEQSGHIREVGFELYQSMLEEAVAAMKGGDLGEAADRWSPEISLGTSVLIPESYVADLQLRLGLYRRLSGIEHRADIDAFAAELVDRFGALPQEVEHLLDVMEIKGLCRSAGIARIDAGPKGAVVTFRGNDFANPAGLAQFLQASRALAKMQPDHKVVYKGDWDLPEKRVAGVRSSSRSWPRSPARAEGGLGPVPETGVSILPRIARDPRRSTACKRMRSFAALASDARQVPVTAALGTVRRGTAKGSCRSARSRTRPHPRGGRRRSLNQVR